MYTCICICIQIYIYIYKRLQRWCWIHVWFWPSNIDLKCNHFECWSLVTSLMGSLIIFQSTISNALIKLSSVNESYSKGSKTGSLHNRPAAQIPQCTSPVSHNEPLCNKMFTCEHTYVTKGCIVGYLTKALWDLWDGSIVLGRAILRPNNRSMTPHENCSIVYR